MAYELVIEIPRFNWICRFLLLLLPFISATVLSAQISPEAGAFFSQQYRPEAYGASPQNWAVVQNNEGVMFFGNTDGLLEYDGATWRRVKLSNGSAVRSLAADARGTVYVGGQNELGYLKADSTGTLQYVSLVEKIPAPERNFGDIWTVNVTDAGVLFSSSRALFRWSPEHGMRVWKPSSLFGNRVIVAEGVPYLVSQGSGLLRLEGDSLKPVPGGEVFVSQNDLVGVFSFAGSLIFAKPNGLYRYEGNKFQRFVTGADKLLQNFRLYTCKVLRGGDLALGTVQGGLLLVDSAGHLERVINKSSGLASNAINAIYTDRDHGVWLALNRGLARLDADLPLTQFGDREGLDDIVNDIKRHGSTIYAGTGVGLSQLVSSPGAVPHFVPVAGVTGVVPGLLSTKYGLLAGGAQGLYIVEGDQSKLVLRGDMIFNLSLAAHNSDLLYAAGRRGLHLLHFDGANWRPVLDVPSEGQAFRSVVEDSDGRLWTTTRTSIMRLDLASTPVKVERYAKEQGVPVGWNFVFRVRDQVLFATAEGLLRFDESKKRFVSYDGFGKRFADRSHPVRLVQESPTGDIWISGDTYQGILHQTSPGNYTWDENPLARSGIKEVYALYLDPDNVAWASGTDGGLVRYQVLGTSIPNNEFKASIRTVQLLRANQTLFGGVGKDPNPVQIGYQQNAVRFRFVASSYENEFRTQYQVYLQGLDRKWSDWSSETTKEYTNLGIGHYLFQVRARDLHGRISEEDSFPLSVLAPWYRSWWAYAFYAFAVVGVIWLIVRWRVFSLAERNRKLEEIILERTDEIRSQRDAMKLQEEKTETLLLNILPRPVADELRSTGAVIPTAYDDITVCFTDFVGFTLSSERIPASDLVSGLHRYFSAFDEIVSRYGLEKMKTIGDSYMFVGGLPERKTSHAVDAVMAALEIAEIVTSLSETFPSWDIRIGLHSGPVIAGVVGMQKFAFDIWGETVNFASRFESSGRANRVNISARTYELVRDFIECEPRGLVRIKEGRLLDMYFAVNVRRELLAESSNGDPNAFSQLYRQKFGRFPQSIPSLKSSLSMSQEAGKL